MGIDNGVLSSHKRQWNYIDCRKIDGTRDHHILKRNKLDLEKQATNEEVLSVFYQICKEQETKGKYYQGEEKATGHRKSRREAEYDQLIVCIYETSKTSLLCTTNIHLYIKQAPETTNFPLLLRRLLFQMTELEAQGASNSHGPRWLWVTSSALSPVNAHMHPVPPCFSPLISSVLVAEWSLG